MRRQTPVPAGSRIRVPTLLLWGARDRFLDQDVARPSINLCADGRLELFEDATHWVHLGMVDAVNRSILQFLKEKQ